MQHCEICSFYLFLHYHVNAEMVVMPTEKYNIEHNIQHIMSVINIYTS